MKGYELISVKIPYMNYLPLREEIEIPATVRYKNERSVNMKFIYSKVQGICIEANFYVNPENADLWIDTLKTNEQFEMQWKMIQDYIVEYEKMLPTGRVDILKCDKYENKIFIDFVYWGDNNESIKDCLVLSSIENETDYFVNRIPSPFIGFKDWLATEIKEKAKLFILMNEEVG